MMRYERSSSVAGFFRADIALHQTERHVHPSGHSGGCPNLAVGDKDAIHFNRCLWKSALQIFREQPVCRRPAAVEQTRLAEDKSSDADGGDPTRIGERTLQEREHLWRWRPQIGRRSNEQRVEGAIRYTFGF